jgi:hypothetical protein
MKALAAHDYPSEKLSTVVDTTYFFFLRQIKTGQETSY